MAAALATRHQILLFPELLCDADSLRITLPHCMIASPLDRRNPARVYSDRRGILRPRSRGRAYSRVGNRHDCYGRCNATSVELGKFRERFERLAYLKRDGECGRSRRLVSRSSSLNGNRPAEAEETKLDLEVEVFKFMQQSSNPDAFPTRQDLILAGRADLVMSIEEEGGWLAAGWEDGSNFDTTENKTDGGLGVSDDSGRQLSKTKFKTSSLKRSYSKPRKSSARASTFRNDEPALDVTERVNGIHVVREVANAVDDKDGRWHDCRKKSNQNNGLNIDGERHEVGSSLLERPQVPYKEKSIARRRKSSSGPRNIEGEGQEVLPILEQAQVPLKEKSSPRRRKSSTIPRNIDGEPQEVLTILERAQVPLKVKSTPRRRKSSSGPTNVDGEPQEVLPMLEQVPLKEKSTRRRKSSSGLTNVDGETQEVLPMLEQVPLKEKSTRRRKSSSGPTNVDGETQEVSPMLEQVPSKEKSSRRMKSPIGPRFDDLQTLQKIASLFGFTGELKLKRPQVRLERADLSQDSTRNDCSGAVAGTTSQRIYPENGSAIAAVDEVPAQNCLRDSRDTVIDVAAQPKTKRTQRKEGGLKVVMESSTDDVNVTQDWIQKVVDEREELMRETRSRPDENLFQASVEDDANSMQSRIHTLAARLADTRVILQTGREALWLTENEEEEQKRTIAEVMDEEDTLEFRENAIMHARTELITTRAQIAAIEGNLKVEMMEARRILDDRNQQIERLTAVRRQLRTTRIVWPNHGNQVFLTGSFDGWNRQIEMEKSSAGVFVVSLTLYPGKYEIKFVVDGSWRVDTNRPIVYVGGYENNVLNIS